MNISGINTKPTEGQKIAGNYRKGHARVHGLDITIENPAGSSRSGIGADGKRWTSRLPNHYGYIRGTAGADGDHVDVYLGPHLKSPNVFVIDQHEMGGGNFDEHKCMLGFGSKKQAVSAYARAFSDGKGHRRIGHVEPMSVERFKEWLRAGNARFPAKGRAAGGRVGYAEGGAPAFDQTSEVPPFEATAPAPADKGMLSAAGYGAAQGLTFNMADEVAGARNAAPKIPGTNMQIPDFVGVIPARTIAGGIRAMVSPEGGADYAKGRDEFRAADKLAKEQHPWVHAGAELAGAAPAMAALPELGAARALAPTAGRMAKFGAGLLDASVTGGEYGALAGAGEGEGLGDRALKSAQGIVSGIIGGAGAHAIGTGIGAGIEKFAKPVVQTVRGWMDPNGEAARRLASALRSDQEMITAGTARGMTPQQWIAARQAGEPVTLADLGSSRTQALLRSAANTSPEARAQLEQVIEQRFLTQGDRTAGTVRNLLPQGEANARKSGDQLVAEYDAGRVPAYQRAYAQGDKPIMSPAMERMMSSDTFVAAMKRAISSGKDRDVAMGLGGFNPMVNVTPDGRIVFNKGAQGVPTYPNLQYWDQVKRELDSVASQAKRSGDTASVAGDLARILRGELDQQVPSYASARGIAEKYFGEGNALEAGQKLAGKKVDPAEVSQIMRQMKPDERALFQEGYASDLANRVIGNMADTTNITKGRGLLASPNERKMAAAIFGPGGMAQLQARMHLETIMDGARQAMGNSTTARQLIEAGLAGGAGGIIGGASSGWDPIRTAEGFGAGAGARFGSHLLKDEIKVGAKHLIGKVDARTARRVAELLTSDDPRLLRQGYQMAAKSAAITDGLKRIANRVALAGQTSGRVSIPYKGPNLGELQGPVPSYADTEQQQP